MWKFIVLFKFILVNCTVDMERSQFEYITDHLSVRECRRLVAAIQYNSHQLNEKALDSAEDSIPDEIKCIDLLLEWNNTEKKGRSQTHQIVCLRLRQLGHPEIAFWLSNNVYKKLEQQQIAHPESISEETTSQKSENVDIISEESWSIFISIEHIILMTIFILTIQNLLYPCLKIVCFFGISRLKKKRTDDCIEKRTEESIPLVNVISEEDTSECEYTDIRNSEAKV